MVERVTVLLVWVRDRVIGGWIGLVMIPAPNPAAVAAPPPFGPAVLSPPLNIRPSGSVPDLSVNPQSHP